MKGYYKNDAATLETIRQGWLHTGDKARIENNQLYITGRLKEIIVLANGEKVPPADMEMTICMDSLIDQAMVVGDNRPYLTALLVINPEQFDIVCGELGLAPCDSGACASSRVNQFVLERVAKRLSSFPGYARIRRVKCMLEPWTIEDGLITPTLKLKRDKVYQRFQADIDAMYSSR